MYCILSRSASDVHTAMSLTSRNMRTHLFAKYNSVVKLKENVVYCGSNLTDMF